MTVSMKITTVLDPAAALAKLGPVSLGAGGHDSADYGSGKLPREIAAIFSVSRAQTARIVTGKVWTHVA